MKQWSCYHVEEVFHHMHEHYCQKEANDVRCNNTCSPLHDTLYSMLIFFINALFFFFFPQSSSSEGSSSSVFSLSCSSIVISLLVKKSSFLSYLQILTSPLHYCMSFYSILFKSLIHLQTPSHLLMY